MKKSTQITLTVLTAAALAGCSRRRDPCDQAYFNDMTCQEAVQNGGYYYNGSWVRMYYPHPYPYYYDTYSHYVSRGGRVAPTPAQTYAKPGPGKTFGSGAHATSSSGTSHGGFGATGSGHSSGS
jgi:hypothetical protein